MTVCVVVNPTKVTGPELVEQVASACRKRGRGEPRLLETTEDDPGEHMVRAAAADGATLVLSAGGDGTVMSVARGLAHTGVPLGILPFGTGNLLARNLDLPLDRDAALQVALDGHDRDLDLGMLAADGAPAAGFAVMAGVGFDAAMMADAPEGLKSVAGWAAYVVSGARHLRDRPMSVELSVDGQPAQTRSARCVVVGNVGALQGGLRLIPDARPDDGLLDVVVLSPQGLADWARVIVRLATRRPGVDRDVERLRGRSITLRCAVAGPLELDGDPAGTARHLQIDVDPGALRVRVPR